MGWCSRPRAAARGGCHYLLDTKRNVITPLEQDIEAYARKLGVLAAWEELV